ncbi:DUF3800 domain-containing protein [Pseudonocardia sp. NPDC049635]|uniref:DUF3800 domain-containing protein n=1 Tax=Pseudonocardia sp. NPDC049635 TaxID=3155506 RepID=UPI0033DD7A4A
MPRTRETSAGDCPSSTIFVDESGAATTGSKFFVVAGIKVRKPGELARAIKHVRERHSHPHELKFSRVNSGNVIVFSEIITALEESDAHIGACVVKGTGRLGWEQHARVIAQLLWGCINRGERVGVLMDAISTPVGESLEERVRSITNGRLRSNAVVSAVCLDSKSTDLLQVADLVAGAIMHERRRAADQGESPRSPKGRVAKKLATAFEAPGLLDGHEGRVRITTVEMRARTRGGPARSQLRAV